MMFSFDDQSGKVSCNNRKEEELIRSVYTENHVKHYSGPTCPARPKGIHHIARHPLAPLRICMRAHKAHRVAQFAGSCALCCPVLMDVGPDAQYLGSSIKSV
jgi:hypothetical protein